VVACREQALIDREGSDLDNLECSFGGRCRWSKSIWGLAGARPSGRKSLRRRDIQRRDALPQVPNYCWDRHDSQSRGDFEALLVPGSSRKQLNRAEFPMIRPGTWALDFAPSGLIRY